MIENSAYSKHIPSVFAVSSPFQILCAAAAIKQLEITEYKMAVCYDKKDSRNQQMWYIFDFFGMNDRVLMHVNRRNIFVCKILSLFHRKTHYKRLFIGDFRGFYDFILGTRLVADGSDIVYLDDGNITLSLLNNVFTEPMELSRKEFVEKVASKRRFVVNKNLLTIYEKIFNPKYNINVLNLNIILNDYKKQCPQKEAIIIVGTCLSRYCEPLEIPAEQFVEKLDSLVKKLKKEMNLPIIYIPHGRDESEYAKKICKTYDIGFMRPKMMIEMELLDQGILPCEIYGFTSSALYNLKKIYPQAKVVNILYHACDNKFYEEYSMMSDYYQQNGIEFVKEEIV